MDYTCKHTRCYNYSKLYSTRVLKKYLWLVALVQLRGGKPHAEGGVILNKHKKNEQSDNKQARNMDGICQAPYARAWQWGLRCSRSPLMSFSNVFRYEKCDLRVASLMCIMHMRDATLTPVAGLIFETKNRAIFLERFFWRDFSGAAFYCPYNFVPIN